MFDDNVIRLDKLDYGLETILHEKSKKPLPILVIQKLSLELRECERLKECMLLLFMMNYADLMDYCRVPYSKYALGMLYRCTYVVSKRTNKWYNNKIKNATRKCKEKKYFIKKQRIARC